MMRLTATVLCSSVMFTASCGGTVTTPNSIVPTAPAQNAISPAPNEADTATVGFGRFEAIEKRAPNEFDGIRYVDAIGSDGNAYRLRVYNIYGPTGSTNILYRGDGAYFHDMTEEDEDNLAAGIGFKEDGTWLGGYMSRNGESFDAPSGEATYEGTYLGHIREYSNIPVTGDVELTANFDTNRIHGFITNRNVPLVPFAVDNPQYLQNDFYLRETDISEGGFGATIGQYNGITLQGASGFYGGLFDQDGDKAIGLVQVNHSNTVNGQAISFTESGIYTAD